MRKFVFRAAAGPWFAPVAIFILTRSAARAFDARPPRAERFSAEPLLVTFAQFTADKIDTAHVCGEDPALIRRALFDAGEKLGGFVRHWFAPKTPAECLEVLSLLYRTIGIELTGKLPGEVQVRRCYFADVYDPHACRVMSGMDAGLFAGICGGGTLEFCERITEGCAVCRARFEH